MIEVETPDGGIAEFPDGTSPDAIKAALRRRFQPSQPANPKPELSWGQTATDVIGGAAQGFQSGFQALLGLPGDAQQLAGSAASWGAGKLGFSPEVQEGAKTLGLPQLPTTPDVNAAFESVLGPKIQPQTDAGRYARTIGEFAPAAMAGPGGLVRKAAMSVIPGVAVEGTGDLTGDNPYAKAAAGITAAVLTAGRGNAGTRQAIKEAPSAKEIGDQTNQLYNTLRNAGIAYDNNAYARFVTDLQREMKSRGYRPRQNNPSPIAADLEELAFAANNPLDFSEIESLRKSIGKNLPATASKEDRAAAEFVKSKFDEFLESAPLISNGNLPAGQVGAITKQARELASRNIKNRIVEEAIDNARLAASGFENGLRIEFRKIAKNPSKFRGFSKAEKNAILSMIGGTTPQNLMAQFGRLGISLDRLTSKASLLPTIVAGGGASLGAMLPAAGVVGAATGAKYASRLMAERSSKNLSALMRAGKEEQKAAAAADAIAKRNARIRAALSSDAALRAGGENWFLQDASGRQYPMPVPAK